jgi:two-component system nitrate/nitrite response regulator NarL
MAARVLEMLRTFSARLGHMRPVRSPLSNRQWQVLDLLADGHSSAEIAQILGISADTVRGHRRQVMRGLGASSTADAVRAARGLRTGPLTR